jgi:uncharacterized protein YciI
MSYFVVTTEQGPAWDDTLSMREQSEWAGHAVYMNGISDDGFVALGGPIAGGARHRARLIVKANSEEEVRSRLAADPWAEMGLLVIESIEEWEVLLGDDSET